MHENSKLYLPKEHNETIQYSKGDAFQHTCNSTWV